MNLAATAPSWLSILLVMLLFLAAGEDAWRLRISNVTILVVLAGAIAFGLGSADLAKGFLERRLVARSKSSAVDDLHHL